MNMRRTGNVVGPLIIIAVGVVLLLNTIGVLQWSAWSEIGRYWPVLVIGLGLSIFWRQLRGR